MTLNPLPAQESEEMKTLLEILRNHSWIATEVTAQEKETENKLKRLDKTIHHTAQVIAAYVERQVLNGRIDELKNLAVFEFDSGDDNFTYHRIIDVRSRIAQLKAQLKSKGGGDA